MIPSNKFDEKAVEDLQHAPDSEVIENAELLLEWLQDRNWPVFDGVVKRLSNLGEELLGPICTILESEDSIWKANIVGYLIPKFSPVSQLYYSEFLERLLNNPADNDLREGVIDFIEIQLSNAKNYT